MISDSFRCADGTLPDPLDLMHLLFSNNGSVGVQNSFACYHLTPYRSAFLERILPPSKGLYTREGLIDSIVCFAIACFLFTMLTLCVQFLWNKMDRRFAKINPPHKKWYVVVNVGKCLVLGIQALSYRYWMGAHSAFVLDQFSNLEIKRIIVMYVCTDAVALYMVPKLPFSTILHHVTTTVLSLVIWGLDLSISGWTGPLGLIKMLTIYGTYSTLAFSVNGYLALRVVYPGSYITSLLCKFGLITYIICCIANWLTQFFWLVLVRDITIYIVLYFVCLSFVIHDDVMLISWLWAKNSPVNKKKE